MLLKIIGGVAYENIKQVKEGRYIKHN